MKLSCLPRINIHFQILCSTANLRFTVEVELSAVNLKFIVEVELFATN
jgi:hypothetical protein